MHQGRRISMEEKKFIGIEAVGTDEEKVEPDLPASLSDDAIEELVANDTEHTDANEQTEQVCDSVEEEPAEETVEEGEQSEGEDIESASDSIEEVHAPAFEDFEVMVELPYEVEFHSDIVEKSERKNAENYIKLVSDKVLEEPEEPIYEDVFKPEEESTEPPTPIAEYSLYEDFDPEQIAMSFDEAKTEPVRDNTVYDEKRPRIVDRIFDAIEILAITLTAAIVITTIFFRFSFVDGHSMDRTLADGDTLLISNMFYTPDYGDVVVFEYVNELGERRPLVKRVIGLEGDEIQVTKNGEVYRNGELLEEDYVYLDGKIPVSLSGAWKVREGEIFVMGDHRNDSKDSREIGPIKENAILGRAVLRLFPFDSFGSID